MGFRDSYGFFSPFTHSKPLHTLTSERKNDLYLQVKTIYIFPSLDGKENQQSEFARQAEINDARIQASSVEMCSWGFPFSCGVCEEKFEEKTEITDHFKYSHPDPNQTLHKGKHSTHLIKFSRKNIENWVS